MKWTMSLLGPILLASPTLKVGDEAPPLRISKWISGKPVVLAEGKGKNIYVVEFWATWCGPCLQSIPHLNKLAGHFEKKDVVVVGVSVDDEDTREKVEPFVKEMGHKMGYRVALDDRGATNEAYMLAAGVEGIPHAFLISKDGKLVWHGHPMDGLDIKLAELVGDKAYAESCRKLHELRRKIQTAWRGKNWDEAILVLDAMMALEPDEVLHLVHKYNLLAAKKKDRQGAEKLATRIVERLEDVNLLNELSWGILTAEEYAATRDLKLALAAARKANDLSQGKDWSILDTYARALFDTGSKKEALELQKKSIEIAEKEEVDEEQLQTLKLALKRYQGTSGEEPEGKKAEGEKD